MTSLQLPGAMSRTLQHAFAGILLSGIAVCAAQAQAIKPGDIAPFEVTFEVGNNLISAGTARLRLTESGGLWIYSLNTKPKGIFKLAGKGWIAEQSTFRLTETDGQVHIRPQTYQYRQDDERRRQVDAKFDWDASTLTHVYRGTEATFSMNEPVLDRLSVTLLIMNSLRNGFARLELPVFDSGEIKQVEFVNEGPEVLKTYLGSIETVRVSNRNAIGGNRKTSTWFAPSLDYLPVKIEHRKRDELVARLSLLSLTNRDTTLQLREALPVVDEEDLPAQALPSQEVTGETLPGEEAAEEEVLPVEVDK
jgi:hypothetical protein